MNAPGMGSPTASRVQGRRGNAIGRASEILRAEGARVLWFRILGETVYRRMILFERQLEEPSMADVRCQIPLVISQLGKDEVDEYSAFRTGTDANEVRSRLEQGHLCWLARSEGTMVHTIWAAIGSAWIRYLECEIRLAADEAYIYESYTAPPFRRLNINAARAGVMVRYFRDRSFVRLLALVMPENPAGIRATVSAGYRAAGVIRRVNVGSWQRYFSRPIPCARPVILSSHQPGQPT
jgi:hypothetical protein